MTVRRRSLRDRQCTAVALAAVIALMSCGKETSAPAVEQGRSTSSLLVPAIERFVAAGRTPTAFRDLAREVADLARDATTDLRSEAERRLVVLARYPVESVQGLDASARAEALALTVWPTLLAAPLDALASAPADSKPDALAPLKDEDVPTYLQRLCGGPLSAECLRIVPEHRSAAVDSIASHRGAVRARRSVEACDECRGDPAWHDAIRSWEELERDAARASRDLGGSDPSLWPIAGVGSVEAPHTPDVKVTPTGQLAIGDHRYARTDGLSRLRAERDAVQFHVPPDSSIGELARFLATARLAGVVRTGVIARAPVYPWHRRVYWLTSEVVARSRLRSSDSVQRLLEFLDGATTRGARTN